MLPIHYIHLNSRTDRRTLMEQQLANLGLKCGPYRSGDSADIPAENKQL
jgi:hypothetical protein